MAKVRSGFWTWIEICVSNRSCVCVCARERVCLRKKVCVFERERIVCVRVSTVGLFLMLFF